MWYALIYENTFPNTVVAVSQEKEKLETLKSTVSDTYRRCLYTIVEIQLGVI